MLEETWRSFVSLEQPEARRAFLSTVRGLIDLGGQRVTASDRMYLAAELPTLIVWGEKDPLIPVRHARDAHASMPASRLEVFPDAGHFPHRDAPRRFATTPLDFVRSTEPMPADALRLRRRLRAATAAAAPARRPRAVR